MLIKHFGDVYIVLQKLFLLKTSYVFCKKFIKTEVEFVSLYAVF
jgi:hypothetical protein